MLEIFPWSGLLETGIESIDRQHRRLVDLLNELAQQYVKGEDFSATQRIVSDLADYAVYHFDSEEAIWHAALPAADVESHEATHQAFADKIRGLQNEPLDRPELQQELLGFLTEWLAFHILDTDRTMAWVVLGLRQGLNHEQAVAAAEQRKQGEEGRLAGTIMSLYRRMTTQTLALMREREAYLRGLSQQHATAQSWLREDLLRAQQIGRIGSWKVDIESGRSEWSPETCRILGVRPDQEVTPDDFFATIHPDDLARVEAAWEAAQAGADYEIQHRISRTDGVIWVLTRADFHTDPESGRHLAIGTIQDITEDILRAQKEQFEQHFRTLVAEVSARFLSALTDERFDQAMNRTLAELGELFDVDRTFLFLIHDDGIHWGNTHEWCAAGVEPQIDNLQSAPLDDTPWWVNQLRQNRPVKIDRVAALPDEAAAERELLQSQDIQSLLSLPTRDHNQQLTGFIGFDSVRQERVWNDEQVKMLQVIADIVSSAHARKAAARALAENRADLLRAQQVARIGSWKYDFSRDHLEWSPETYRLFEVEPDTPMGVDAFLNQVHPEDRDRVATSWQASLAGAPYEIEHRTANSAGRTWVREIAEIHRNEDGNPTIAIGTVQDITAEKDHQRQLKTLAFTDALTGLPNQHGFEQELELRMEQAAQSQFETCLFQIDIDALGQINAAMDMQAGDQILRTIAQRLSSYVGYAGHVGRLGGDQFALAMHNCGGPDDITGQVEALQALISQPIRLDGDVMRISACIGSVHNRGGVITQAGVLLRMADQAIYQAKLGGKNQHVIFDLAQYLSDRSRQHRLADIRQALHEQQLRLHYQPKVNLLTGRLLGLEALLRWQHPERGLLGPGDIIPHIEDHPLMMEVGQWVIDTALNQLQAWQQGGLDTTVSVNVASSQLEHPEFVDRLTARLKASPALKPGQLELEIVETGPMLNMPTAVETFKQLKALGVLISLDDFGTGHSSLQTLSVLAPNIVKVDQSFVLEMLNDLAARSIVQAVLDFSGAFRLRVIAEGVETPEHGRTLLRLGCRYGQGYAVARPMPPGQVIDWLEHWRNQPPDWIGDDLDVAVPQGAKLA